MELLLFLFKTELSEEQVRTVVDDRSERYRSVKGLILKFDLHDSQSHHRGGVFIFDSQENVQLFLDSELAKSTGKAYQFIEPEISRVFEITGMLITNTAMTLHE
jgi:hypothetical protein